MTDARLVKIDVDEASLSSASSDIDHERKVAVHDLLAENSFAPVPAEGGVEADGPFALVLSERNGRLVFDVRQGEGPRAGEQVAEHHLSLSPLRRTIKDYFMLCETYYDAIRAATPEKLETIDMARRAVHDEGTRTLIERLEGKVALDHDTGRRLFTLICSFSLRAGNRGSA